MTEGFQRALFSEVLKKSEKVTGQVNVRLKKSDLLLFALLATKTGLIKAVNPTFAKMLLRV